MSDTEKLGVVVRKRIAQLRERVESPEKYIPVPTGLKDLNTIIGGGWPRDPFYAAIIGEKKMGKTTFGLQFFLSYCESTGLKAILYNLEENKYQAADRAMAMRAANISRTNFFQLKLTDADFEYLEAIANDIDEHESYVNDRLYSLELLFKDASEAGAKVVGIDNFQLLTDGVGRDQREKLVWLSKYIMRKRNEGFIIFLISQGTIDGKSFGSTQVEMDADICLLLQHVFESSDKKRKNPLKGIRRLIVRQSRFSDTGELDVLFDAANSRIRSIEIKAQNPDADDFAEFEEVQLLLHEDEENEDA